MHGTFRSHVERGAVTTVRVGARAPLRGRAWRSTLAVLLAGGCLATLPGAPRFVTATGAPERQEIRQGPLVSPVEHSPVEHLTWHPHHRTRQVAAPNHWHAVVRIVLPEPTPAPLQVDIPSSARLADGMVASLPPPQPVSDSPPIAPQLAVSDAPTPALPADPPKDALRPVDIAQISNSDVHLLNVPALHEPNLATDGEPPLSAKIAAMQITPPPPVRLRESERMALLTEAPTRMTVRIGDAALGKVDFRMGDAGMIDVKLGNLLDLLADHFDTAEFARLRTSAAADAYVSFTQLRAAGLDIRYDAVYDELLISA